MTEKKNIRVLIVDDHGMVRKGLRAYLKNHTDLEVVGDAKNGLEALKVCEDFLPDVVLMDLVMPVMNGIAATREIVKRWPAMQVIALTSFQEKEMVQDVLKAGAISYLLKNVSGDDLAEYIRAAYAGRSMLAREAVEALIDTNRDAPSLGEDLTKREIEVLALLVKGMSNPEIAQKLFISTSTVKAHVSNILSKLGASNRAEAVSLAIQHKLVN